jgi:hypothetical protein
MVAPMFAVLGLRQSQDKHPYTFMRCNRERF